MGTDYGRGVTNINQETGIRYGVIPAAMVDFWDEKSEPEWEFFCPFCGEHFGYDYLAKCPTCKTPIAEEDLSQTDPSAFVYAEEGYFADQEATCVDIFVVSSPYYTICGFCSPCAPGAGDLTSRGSDCKAYCFGHEWFENGAPYHVYRVDNNQEVPLIQTEKGGV